MTRPASISILGWTAIVLGALSILGAAIVLAMFLAARESSYVPLFAGVQLVLAVLAVWAGAALLRLRRWARACLEVVAWLAIVLLLAVSVFWFASATSFAEDGPPLFRIVFKAMGGFVIVVLVVPLVVAIRALRSAAVREALT